MSGRSGYGRSKIVGKLIHLPANMMIAGLAPKVGKSGASIRLYWQRVAECCVGCKDDPIRITKRGIAPGDVVTGNWSNTSGGGTIINASSEVVIDLGQNGRLTNVQYVVVFDKEISSAFAVDPPAGATLELRTPLAVNWSTGVPANQSIYQKSIPPSHDFRRKPCYSAVCTESGGDRKITFLLQHQSIFLLEAGLDPYDLDSCFQVPNHTLSLL